MTRAMFTLAAAAAAAVAGIGCSTSGLSPGEVGGRTQSNYLYSTYDQLTLAPDVNKGVPARPLRLPATVGVVQVGEVAPPQAMIEALRKEPAVFARVETLPFAPAHVSYDAPAGRAVHAQPSLVPLRRLAADAGLDYVLLVGGTIDHDNIGTPLSLLDLTIIGAFAIPSREARGTAKAAAALIDVPSGRAIVNSSAEARRSTFVPSASVEGEETKLMERLRDDVVAKLGTQVLADAKNRAAFGNAGAAPALPPPQVPAQLPTGPSTPLGQPYRTADGGAL